MNYSRTSETKLKKCNWKDMQGKEQQEGHAGFFSMLQQQVSITLHKRWCLKHKHQNRCPVESVESLRPWGPVKRLWSTASKYRPSLYIKTLHVWRTKTFMLCWESRLLLLFILPITSPPAAQHEPPLTTKPHKTHKHAHSGTHTHS